MRLSKVSRNIVPCLLPADLLNTDFHDRFALQCPPLSNYEVRTVLTGNLRRQMYFVAKPVKGNSSTALGSNSKRGSTSKSIETCD